jgi:hypothetical protein
MTGLCSGDTLMMPSAVTHLQAFLIGSLNHWVTLVAHKRGTDVELCVAYALISPGVVTADGMECVAGIWTAAATT